MGSGPETDVKMMATGLAAGILLDATVIRALIVPAVISLMGRWNWWLPDWPARILRVRALAAPSGGVRQGRRLACGAVVADRGPSGAAIWIGVAYRRQSRAHDLSRPRRPGRERPVPADGRCEPGV